MPKKVVDKHYAKGRGDYEKVISVIERQGQCPFCPANFKYHKKPILKRSNGWFITENNWPYKGAKHHLILLGRQHKEHISELTAKDWKAINALAKWASKKFGIKGGAFAFKFGDFRYSGASINHLHAHLIVPKLNLPNNGQPIAFVIDYKKPAAA